MINNMKIIAVMLFSFTSALIFAWIITKKENLSIKPLLYIFLFSFSAVLISILIQTAVEFFFFDFLRKADYIKIILFESFAAAALIEEFTKTVIFYAFVKFLWSDKITKVDENLPGEMREQIRILLFLSILYGLVFASFETLAYTVREGKFIWARLFTSNFLHAAFGIYYLQISMSRKFKKTILPFFSVWILHGLYNMFLSMGIFFSVFSYTIVLFLIGNVLRQYDRFKEN
ncbi:protease PrsW [Treponema pedis]|nr:protease PrsW [Treponema pedis]